MYADGNTVASVLSHPERGLAREDANRAWSVVEVRKSRFQSLLAGVFGEGR